jgi:hypothetical protein
MNFDARIGNESSVSSSYWQGDVASQAPTSSSNTTTSLPQGDGNFSAQAAGTQPQAELDLQLAQMANDSYTLTDANGVTGTQSEQELIAAGWTRLEPAGDHLVDGNGNQVAIDPKMLEDSTSGFRASIYQNDKGQYVVAYAGTNPSEMADIKSDAAQAFGLEDTQYNMAIKLAKEAEIAFGDGNVIFTGHSLGGGLASTAALSVGATAVTFNSAGPSNDTLRDLGFSPNQTRSQLEDSGQIRHYIVDGDPLNLAQKDIPAIPLPIVGALSPPDPVGHPLRIALPEGMRPIIDSHGGSGDGTSYVEALRQNSPYASGSNDNLAADLIGNWGDFKLNVLGSAFETGLNTGKELYGIAESTVSDVRDTLSGDGTILEKSASVAGDVVDGLVGGAGAITGNVMDGAGDLIQDGTDLIGNTIRDLGKSIGLEGPASFLARGVEATGEFANTVTDAVGGAVSWGADKLGDGVEILADFGGKAAQFAVDTGVVVADAVADAAVATSHAIADAAVATGSAIVEGAKIVGNAVVDGAVAAGNAVVDGAKAVGNAVSDAASWVGDKLKFW